MAAWNEIDWTNPVEKITDHFTVKDALWLHSWNRLATEKDGLNMMTKFNICKSAEWMEDVRYILKCPIFIKSWYRPLAYNLAIGGATQSMHMAGRAVDFWCDKNGDGVKNGADCDQIKEILKYYLVQYDLRMEDNGTGARWIHLDDKKVPKGSRFFKP